MKITTEYPTPVPITWILTLSDDEMAQVVADALQSRSATIYNKLYQLIGGTTLERLNARARELAGRP